MATIARSLHLQCVESAALCRDCEHLHEYSRPELALLGDGLRQWGSDQGAYSYVESLQTVVDHVWRFKGHEAKAPWLLGHQVEDLHSATSQ